MPEISVIVPVYKVEKYLDRCVKSILNQTFTDFECILVDDGSPDNCPAMCDKYESDYSNIRVIHKENGGLSDARNAGLDVAAGDYIYFVDSDDYIHPQTLEILLNVIKCEKSDFVSHSFIKTYDTITDFKKIDLNFAVNTYGSEYIIDNLFNEFNQSIGVEAWKKLYKKEVFDSLRFTKGIIHEDDDIFLRILLTTKTASVVDISLYYYFMSDVSIMRSSFSPKEFIRFEIDMRNAGYINDNNIVSQKKLCSIPYFDHYMGFYYYLKEHNLDVIHELKKYRFDYIKNLFYFIKNKNMSNAFLVVAIKFAISPKWAKKMHDKLF